MLQEKRRFLCLLGIHKYEPREFVKFTTADGKIHIIYDLVCKYCGKPSPKEYVPQEE